MRGDECAHIRDWQQLLSYHGNMNVRQDNQVSWMLSVIPQENTISLVVCKGQSQLRLNQLDSDKYIFIFLSQCSSSQCRSQLSTQSSGTRKLPRPYH